VADDVGPHGENPQQNGEPHLPSPSIFPFGFAAGIALLLVGLIVGWPIVAIGAAIALVFAFLWIRDATREVRGMPAPQAAPAVEPAAPTPPPRYGRARFLEGATLGLGGLIGAAVTAPVVGFAIAPAFVGQKTQDVNLGPLTNFPEGQFLVTTFYSVEHESVSRRTAFVRNNGMLNSVPSFTIISNRCAHLGCPVQPQGPSDESKKQTVENGAVTLIPTQPSGFGCPCHGGAYDIEGNRTQGPPVRALDRFEYSIVKGNLILGKRYSVAHVDGTGAHAKIEAYNRADPGQHVDGWEAWFYPLIPH